MNNNDRANKVKRLLGLIKDDNKARDDKKHYYRVADVICDLKHYCDKFKIDYDNEIRMADIYYNDERNQMSITFVYRDENNKVQVKKIEYEEVKKDLMKYLSHDIRSIIKEKEKDEKIQNRCVGRNDLHKNF